jgi:hypothetical protein
VHTLALSPTQKARWPLRRIPFRTGQRPQTAAHEWVARPASSDLSQSLLAARKIDVCALGRTGSFGPAPQVDDYVVGEVKGQAPAGERARTGVDFKEVERHVQVLRA